jgi:hypothetical protein
MQQYGIEYHVSHFIKIDRKYFCSYQITRRHVSEDSHLHIRRKNLKSHKRTLWISRAIRKLTSGELLTKKGNEKLLRIYNNTYIIKLLFNVVTVGNEALISGNKFLCLYQRSLPPVSLAMFWHLPSTLHYCWSAVILTSFSGSKQVAVAQSEIKAVRNVVKQLPDEMVELGCEQLYSYAGAQCNGGALHRMSPFHAFYSE